MKVTREDLVALFDALEFKNASRWKKEKMVDTLQDLPDMVDDTTDAGEHQELLDTILEAIDADDDIEIVSKAPAKKAPAKKTPAKKAPAKKAPAKKAEAEEEEYEDADEEEEDADEEEEAPAKKPKRKPNPKAGNTTEKKAKKAKDDGPTKDAWNCRLGSQAATINAAVGKKGRTAEEIAEETDMAMSRVKQHLAAMISKGFVKKDAKGEKYLVESGLSTK